MTDEVDRHIVDPYINKMSLADKIKQVVIECMCNTDEFGGDEIEIKNIEVDENNDVTVSFDVGE